MNKIVATGLSEVNELDFGQIYYRNGEYYIVASSDGSSNDYLLVELTSGSIWSNSRNREDMIEELKKENFQQFKGNLILTVEL